MGPDEGGGGEGVGRGGGRGGGEGGGEGGINAVMTKSLNSVSGYNLLTGDST